MDPPLVAILEALAVPEYLSDVGASGGRIESHLTFFTAFARPEDARANDVDIANVNRIHQS